MASGLRTIRMRFVGDSKGLDRTAANGKKTLSRWQRGFRTLGKAAGVGLAAAGVAAFKLGKDMLAAGQEGIAVSDKLANVFKQMGGAGSNAFKNASKQAAALSKQIGVDQTSIEKVQTKLATFGKIWEDPVKGSQNFSRATQLAFDAAAAGFGNAETNAAQFGRALQDPTKGMSALTRSGITFSAAEQKKIKRLQESGNLLGAQEIVYKALEKQVGGTAAAGATGADKLRAAWENFQDKVGRMLVPVFEKVTRFLTETVLPKLEKFTDWAKNNPGKVKVIAGVIGGVLVLAFIAWAAAAASAAAATIAATWPILAIIAAVAALAVGIFLLVKNWDKVWKFIKKVANAIWQWIKKRFTGIVDAVKGAMKKVWDTIRGAWNTIKNRTVAFLKSLWQSYVFMWGRIIEVVRDKIGQFVGFVKGIPGRVNRALGNAARILIDKGRALIRGLRDGVVKAMKGIKDWLRKTVWDPIVNAVKNLFGISSPSKVFMDFGRQMILGLVKGMIQTNAAKLVRKALGGITGVAGNLFGSIFGGGGKPSANMKLGQAMAAAMGWTGVQWAALRELWMRESSWNHLARNPTSSAYGIPQSLPASKMASAGSDWRTNPATQIEWGLGYIKGRYGSPLAALGFHNRNNWYDQGGLARTAGLIPKLTSQPERVLSPEQTRAFERLVDLLDGGGVVQPLVGTLAVQTTENAGARQILDETMHQLRVVRRRGRP